MTGVRRSDGHQGPGRTTGGRGRPTTLRGSLLALLYSLSGVGTFSHPITLIAASGDTETLDALVDTGASFTTIPASVLERLGVRPHRSVRRRLADGRTVEWRLGWVTAELDGVRENILCAFGDPDTPPLIGAHTLEAFLLAVDPLEHRLVPLEGLLL